MTHIKTIHPIRAFLYSLLLMAGLSGGLFAQAGADSRNSAPRANGAQEEGRAVGLERISDDMKFRNGTSFVKNRLFDKALLELGEYLEIYANGIHRDEAYRLIAEIYFNKFDYSRAVKYYRALYEEFSSSESGIEAYYQIGICYKKMGNDKKAAEIFDQIIEDHPDSVYRRQAEVQRDMINILNDDLKANQP